MSEQDNFTGLFAPEPTKSALPLPVAPWKVLLVDDEADIHAVLRLALQDIVVEGRALQLLDAKSAAEAKARLDEHPEIALILLDVVMETEQAGLDLVRNIRQDLGNRSVQILLVTGQPGYAPQREVVAEYSINGYRLKSELTADKIFVSVYAALRAHQDLVDLEQQRRQLSAQTDALRDAEEKYRTVADHTYDWETWTAPDGSYRYISPACLRISGYRADEFVADPTLMLRLIHPDDRAAMARHFEGVHTNSHLTERVEFRLINRAGAVRWIEHVCHSVLRADGGYLGRRFSNRDITERKLAEEEIAQKNWQLNERTKELQCLYEISIVSFDPRKSLNEVLEAAVRIIPPGFFYSEIACARIVFEERGYATDNFRETPWKLSAEITGDRRNAGALEVCYLEERPRLDEGPFLKEERFLIDELARNLGATVARKRAEAEIRQINAELEQRVDQRTRDLQATNSELESFSYSVSHDLRSPLRAIEGFSALLEKEYAALLDARGKDYFGRVRAAASRMARLIDDMLNLSRISRQEMHRGPVNLSAMAGEVAKELQVTEPERRIEWVIAPQVKVEGDPGLLRIALQNLIGNACKYSSKRADARIEFGVCERLGKPTYFVRDNGAGFDAAYSDKLFGAFQRLHSADEFPGSGIGLATVARVIRRHGGTVGAEGKVNEGATFYFTL